MSNMVELTGEMLDELAMWPEIIEHLDLRSDIENGNLYPRVKLVFAGEVGNDQSMDLTWAIDTMDDGESYLYTSQFEYDRDVAFLTKIAQ